MEHKVEQVLNLLDQLMKRQEQRDRQWQQLQQQQQPVVSGNVT